MKENRNMEFMTFMSKLNRKLIGTNNYYSVSGSIKEVRGLYSHAFWVVYKWMNRRSQRKSFDIDKYRMMPKSYGVPPLKLTLLDINLTGFLVVEIHIARGNISVMNTVYTCIRI